MGSQPWGLDAIASKPDVESPVWAKWCLLRSWLRQPLKRSVANLAWTIVANHPGGSYPGRTPRTRSPHSGASNHSLEVLPAMTGCFDVCAASSPNEGQHYSICNLWMTLPNHWERVGPTGPVGCLGSSSCAAESQSSVPARETGKIPCLLPASDVQQLQKHLPHGRVVLPREFLRRPT